MKGHLHGKAFLRSEYVIALLDMKGVAVCHREPPPRSRLVSHKVKNQESAERRRTVVGGYLST